MTSVADRRGRRRSGSVDRWSCGETRGYGILDFEPSASRKSLLTDYRGAPAFPRADTPVTTLYSMTKAEGANRLTVGPPRS